MKKPRKPKKDVSDKQLEANRQNALKSTGAQTAAGRNRCRMNAMLHNLCGKPGLLPEEDENEYAEFSLTMLMEYAPKTEEEMRLIFQVVAAEWSLRRGNDWEQRIHQESWSITEIIAENSRLDIYRSRLRRTIALILREFRMLRDERLSGKRVLTMMDRSVLQAQTAETTPAAAPQVATAPPQQQLAYTREEGERWQHHLADVQLATMSGPLPQDMVDFAQAGTTSVPLDQIPKNIPAPKENPSQTGKNAPAKADANNAVNQHHSGVSTGEMGSFLQTSFQAGLPPGQGIKFWQWLPKTDL